MLKLIISDNTLDPERELLPECKMKEISSKEEQASYFFVDVFKKQQQHLKRLGQRFPWSCSSLSSWPDPWPYKDAYWSLSCCVLAWNQLLAMQSRPIHTDWHRLMFWRFLFSLFRNVTVLFPIQTVYFSNWNGKISITRTRKLSVLHGFSWYVEKMNRKLLTAQH